MVVFSFLTIFPNIIREYTHSSIWNRAIQRGIIQVNIVDIRDFTSDKHKTVDDRPFGGGPGMVIKFEPVFRALEYVRSTVNVKNTRVFLMDPKGKVITQEFARAFMTNFLPDIHIIFIVPHYEGIDNRITNFVDYQISVGPYITTGGELPALIVADVFVRLIPGVLGNPQSALEETDFYVKRNVVYSAPEAPVYTRPRMVKAGGTKLGVPSVLLEGNHRLISQYRGRFTVPQRLQYLTASDVH